MVSPPLLYLEQSSAFANFFNASGGARGSPGVEEDSIALRHSFLDIRATPSACRRRSHSASPSPVAKAEELAFNRYVSTFHWQATPQSTPVITYSSGEPVTDGVRCPSTSLDGEVDIGDQVAAPVSATPQLRAEARSFVPLNTEAEPFVPLNTEAEPFFPWVAPQAPKLNASASEFTPVEPPKLNASASEFKPVDLDLRAPTPQAESCNQTVLQEGQRPATAPSASTAPAPAKQQKVSRSAQWAQAALKDRTQSRNNNDNKLMGRQQPQVEQTKSEVEKQTKPQLTQGSSERSERWADAADEDPDTQNAPEAGNKKNRDGADRKVMMNKLVLSFLKDPTIKDRNADRNADRKLFGHRSPGGDSVGSSDGVSTAPTTPPSRDEQNMSKHSPSNSYHKGWRSPDKWQNKYWVGSPSQAKWGDAGMMWRPKSKT